MTTDAKSGAKKTTVMPCKLCGHKATFLDGEEEGAIWLGCVLCDVGLEMGPAPAPGKVDAHELARIWNELQTAPVPEMN